MDERKPVGAIKLLIVDDDPLELKKTEVLMRKGNTPWLGHCDLTYLNHVPQDVRDCFEFDGLVTDFMMPVKTGYELCRELHQIDWRFPTLLMTSIEPKKLPLNVLEHCTMVGFKVGTPGAFSDQFSYMRAFLRIIAMKKSAAAMCPEKSGLGCG